MSPLPGSNWFAYLWPPLQHEHPLIGAPREPSGALRWTRRTQRRPSAAAAGGRAGGEAPGRQRGQLRRREWAGGGGGSGDHETESIGGGEVAASVLTCCSRTLSVLEADGVQVEELGFGASALAAANHERPPSS